MLSTVVLVVALILTFIWLLIVGVSVLTDVEEGHILKIVISGIVLILATVILSVILQLIGF